MLLSSALESMVRPIVNLFSEDFDEASYWQPDWLREQLESAQEPDLSDLFFSEQLEFYDPDTNLHVEYSDLEGDEGFGTITSWHHYPYLASINDDPIDPEDLYAYIVSDNGGGTYAHFDSIRVIERVIGYEPINEQQSLPIVLSPVATQGQTTGQRGHQDLRELQHAAGIACEVAS